MEMNESLWANYQKGVTRDDLHGLRVHVLRLYAERYMNYQERADTIDTRVLIAVSGAEAASLLTLCRRDPNDLELIDWLRLEASP